MPSIDMGVRQNNGTFLADGQFSAPVDVLAWDGRKSLHFSGMQLGTFSSASLQIQASNDGVNYAAVDTVVTTDGIVNITLVCAWLRILTNHISSGTPACFLAGHVHSL